MPFCLCPERTYTIKDYENGTPTDAYAKIFVPPPFCQLCIPERATTSDEGAPQHVIYRTRCCEFGQKAKTQHLDFSDKPKQTCLPTGRKSANTTLGKKNQIGCIEGVSLRFSDWCSPECVRDRAMRLTRPRPWMHPYRMDTPPSRMD